MGGRLSAREHTDPKNKQQQYTLQSNRLGRDSHRKTEVKGTAQKEKVRTPITAGTK